MKGQFVPYEIALKLKEKGFDEPCFGYYTQYTGIEENHLSYVSNRISENHNSNITTPHWYVGVDVTAPLWQQVIDWLAETHNIDISTPPFWCGDGRQYSPIVYLKSTGSIDSDNENTFHLFPEKDTKQEAQLMAIEHALTLI